MKKLVILLLLLVPSVFALSSQDWINQHQIQNIVKIGSNLKFEVFDVNNKLVNRDPIVGESFVLSTDADFVWNKVYVYPDNPLKFINSFDLAVKQVGHSVLVIRGKHRGLFTRGRKAVYATYNTESGISDKIDTSTWTPQDYHLIAWTCTTNRNAQWQSNGVWDCSWKVHTFTLKPVIPPTPPTPVLPTPVPQPQLIEAYIVVDDIAPASDVVIAAKLMNEYKNILTNKFQGNLYKINVLAKLDSEVTRLMFENTSGAIIDKGVITPIVGSTALAKHVIATGELSQYASSQNLKVEKTKLNTDFASDDLIP